LCLKHCEKLQNKDEQDRLRSVLKIYLTIIVIDGCHGKYMGIIVFFNLNWLLWLLMLLMLLKFFLLLVIFLYNGKENNENFYFIKMIDTSHSGRIKGWVGGGHKRNSRIAYSNQK
jgi:hypothetical protein